jgi:PHD/YefM family antitoxin component YafN of YafNO toxin-antitoxin module
MIKSITLKELRPLLPKVIGDIEGCLDRYIISKRGREVAVMLNFEEYQSMLETLSEIEDSENLRKLRRSLKEAKKNKTISWEKIRKKYRL